VEIASDPTSLFAASQSNCSVKPLLNLDQGVAMNSVAKFLVTIGLIIVAWFC
jgi:hypothetical protein